MYGRGKDDQPYLYQHADPLKLLLGVDRHPPSVTAPRPDLPRNCRRPCALIGDPRNDENVIVGQLQSLFLRFHNKRVDQRRRRGTADAFAEAQRLVRWHYQWLVVHDFLPRIVGDAMVATVLPSGRPAAAGFYRPGTAAFMPVEFSVAAYRSATRWSARRTRSAPMC